MALPLTTCPSFHLGNVNKPLVFRVNHHKIGVIGLSRTNNRRSFTMMVGGSACPFKFPEEPILKEAVKVSISRMARSCCFINSMQEPVAFLGGMFAGLLRLDLNEEPLKEWVSRTVEASGLTEDVTESSTLDEEVPQQIEIE